MKNVYRKAVEIFDQRGGAKGNYLDQNGQVCVLGALGLALGYEERQLDPYDEDHVFFADLPMAKILHRIAGEQYPDWGCERVGWSSEKCQDGRHTCVYVSVVNDNAGPGAARAILEKAAVQLEESEYDD